MAGSFNAEHINCSGTTRITQRQIAESLVAKSAVISNTSIAGKSLQHHLRTIEGFQAPSRMTYRAKDTIISSLQGDYILGYRQLESLLKKFKSLNPTSSVAFETNGEMFNRAFLMSPIAASAQSFLPRILGTDGAHIKHREYNGIILILVGRDGNNSNVIMAVALCLTENAVNYTWFLQQCINGGISFENLPLFCNRGRWHSQCSWSTWNLFTSTMHPSSDWKHERSFQGDIFY